jgi:adenylate cyclase
MPGRAGGAGVNGPDAPGGLSLRGRPLADAPGIAVLSFANLSADPAQRYLSDGITEDVVVELSRFRELLVSNPAGDIALERTDYGIRAVARALGVRYLLEGSVRREGDRLRISVRLFDGEAGELVAADRYDTAMTDVFAVQEEIARLVAGRIQPELVRAEMQRAERAPVGDLVAYDRAVLARARLSRGADSENGEMIAEGLRLAREAAEIDPSCAEAYRTLAWGHCLRGELGFFGPDAQADYAAAESAAARLRELDPHHYAAYAISGHIAMRQLRHEEALTGLRQAERLNPNAPVTLRWLSWEESNHGLPDLARARAELSLRLSPRDYMASLGHWTVALADYVAGDLARCLPNARLAVTGSPRYAGFNILLAACLAELGEVAQARAVVERIELLCPGLFESRVRGNTYFADPALARRYVAALRRARDGASAPAPTPAPEPGTDAPELRLLTSREREVLALIGRGMSNAHIGAELAISENTVKRHVASILGKLDLPRRSAAASLAGRLRLA